MSDTKPEKIKKKKILFMAAAGSHNLGDELILQGEVDYIKKQYGENISITVSTYDRTSTLLTDTEIRYVSYFPNDIRHHFFRNIGYFFYNIWLIARSDVMIVGGGGILFDNEPGVSFGWLLWQWSLRISIARMFHTTILFWGIGLELVEVSSKMKLKKLFKPGDLILVRDTQSKWLLDALEVPSLQIQDIVFLHQPSSPPDIDVIESKRVGISIRWGFLGYNEGIVPLIHDRLVELGYTPVFLMFSTAGTEYQNDALFIQKTMIGKTYNRTQTIEQTLSVYPSLYAVVGMRLHAGILACVHEIPYLPISYGPKTNDLISMLDVEHLALIAREATIEAFDASWQSLTSNYAAEQANMRDKHISIREQLIKNLRNI
jgi:polysaccharide pyruvyl transferase WcaK-like protein